MRRRFVGAVAQAHHPVGGVLLVVARLLQRLAGDGGQLGVADVARRCHSSFSQVATQQVAQHGVGEVTARRSRRAHRQLDQRQLR
jgi:hypothetical protein